MSDGLHDGVLCPSAPAANPDASVLGVVERTGGEARLAYLRPGDRVEAAALLSEHGLHDVMQTVRFSGACAGGSCAQYAHGRCDLARRIVERMAPVVRAAPNCNIRRSCRWFSEHGLSACQRCPAVSTLVSEDDPLLFEVADFSGANRAES